MLAVSVCYVCSYVVNAVNNAHVRICVRLAVCKQLRRHTLKDCLLYFYVCLAHTTTFKRCLDAFQRQETIVRCLEPMVQV